MVDIMAKRSMHSFCLCWFMCCVFKSASAAGTGGVSLQDEVECQRRKSKGKGKGNRSVPCELFTSKSCYGTQYSRKSKKSVPPLTVDRINFSQLSFLLGKMTIPRLRHLSRPLRIVHHRATRILQHRQVLVAIRAVKVIHLYSKMMALSDVNLFMATSVRWRAMVIL